MKRPSIEKRVQVIAALVEGASIGGANLHKNTAGICAGGHRQKPH